MSREGPYADVPVVSIPHFRRIHRRPGFVGLEDYGFESGGWCLCGHYIGHHAPSAVGRPCEREKCGCMGFLSRSGAEPRVQWASIGWDRRSWTDARRTDLLSAEGLPYADRHGHKALVKGPIIDLGFGVDNRRGRFGFRPLFWYIAMGYLSGYPMGAVFAFVWRTKVVRYFKKRLWRRT